MRVYFTEWSRHRHRRRRGRRLCRIKDETQKKNPLDAYNVVFVHIQFPYYRVIVVYRVVSIWCLYTQFMCGVST